MADDSQTLRRIDWREAFPFTHLFRAFRVAVHPSKLVLGLVLLLLLYCGGRFLDSIWPRRDLALPGEITQYEMVRWSNDQTRFLRVGREQPREFEEWREQQWHENADRYARLLESAQLASGDAARQAASQGEYLGELEQHIVAQRNQAQAGLWDTYQKSLKDAGAIQDSAARSRAEAEAKRAYAFGLQQTDERAMDALRQLRALQPRGIFIEFFEYEARQVNDVVNGVLSWNWIGGFHPAAGLVAEEPAPGVIRSIANFAIVAPAWMLAYHWLYFTLFVVWFLLLWAVFGGAIARIAAVHIARDEKISVRQALSFSFGKILSFIFAPVIPMLIVLFLGAVVALGALLFYIPWIGPIIAGIGFVLALVAGFVMTLVSLGTVGGFNLMYPTVAVEGSDSFDAISRSFSYVFARPWRMLWYTLVAIVYGALCFLFVRYFIYVLLALTHFFVGWWLAGQPGHYFQQIWPGPSPTNLTYDINFAGLKWSEAVCAVAIAFWVYIVVSLLGAYVISFYFSANTIIYYLMRREVDATELDDVYVEETDEDFGDRPAAPPGSPETVPPAAETAGRTVTVVEEIVVVPEPTAGGPPPPSAPAPAEPSPGGT